MESEELTAWMAEMRPRLHRYCARMVGSAFEGEDVVQEALVHALQAWPMAGDIRQPQAWLMRIAHNAALDALRRREGWLARCIAVWRRWRFGKLSRALKEFGGGWSRGARRQGSL